MAIRYQAPDGREWTVTLETPGDVLSVPDDLQRSGAQLPQNQVRIVFTAGDEQYSEEYTELAALEDLSSDDLREWFEAARRGRGV